MDRLLLVALASLALAPVLAGCASVAAEPVALDSTPAYLSAVEKGLELDPSARLRELTAFDGPHRAHPNRESLLAQDGGDDGVRGDGLANAWVATFSLHGSDGQGTGGLEVQVFADGTLPKTRLDPDLETSPGESRSEGPDLAHWQITSQQAASIVANNGTFAQHVADYPNAGYVYHYSPYSPPQALYDWGNYFFGAHDAMPEPEATGWAVYGNQWVIVHYDPDAEGVPSVATAVVDASNGKLLYVQVSVPRTFAMLLEADENFEDPIPINPLDPPVFTVPFEVPEGTTAMETVANTFRGAVGVSVLGIGQATLELLDPSGNVIDTEDDTFGYFGFPITNPPAGTWTWRITHNDVVPGSTHFYAYVYGIVPEGSVEEPSHDDVG